MLVDVSDLFDDMFDIASVAGDKFPKIADRPIGDDPAWEHFCINLSDAFFLPACLQRWAGLVSQPCNLEDIRRRVVVRHPGKRQGRKMWYSHPTFFRCQDRPKAFVANLECNGQISQFHAVAGEPNQLALYIGRWKAT